LNWEEFDFGLVKINLRFGLSEHGLRVCQDLSFRTGQTLGLGLTGQNFCFGIAT
jgi:hypothetical protein